MENGIFARSIGGSSADVVTMHSLIAAYWSNSSCTSIEEARLVSGLFVELGGSWEPLEHDAFPEHIEILIVVDKLG